MAYGFEIKNSSGVTTLNSTETTALLQEVIVQTTTGAGSKTFTGTSGTDAYAIVVPSGVGASLFSGLEYGIVTSVVGGEPKISWDIQCNIVGELFGSCSDWDSYNIITFIK